MRRGSTETKPPLQEEMELFKAIMRHVARQEVAPEQAPWFAMEGRQRLRRLAKLGIEGHQPAVAAYVKMSKEENDRIAESIVMQKAGSNAKHIKGYKEFVERRA